MITDSPMKWHNKIKIAGMDSYFLKSHHQTCLKFCFKLSLCRNKGEDHPQMPPYLHPPANTRNYPQHLSREKAGQRPKLQERTLQLSHTNVSSVMPLSKLQALLKFTCAFILVRDLTYAMTVEQLLCKQEAWCLIGAVTLEKDHTCVMFVVLPACSQMACENTFEFIPEKDHSSASLVALPSSSPVTWLYTSVSIQVLSQYSVSQHLSWNAIKVCYKQWWIHL